MDMFLPPFLQKVDKLNALGVKVSTTSGVKNVRVKLLFGVFDMIAKAPVTQFNGKFGCPECTHPGSNKNRRHLTQLTLCEQTNLSTQQHKQQRQLAHLAHL